jgi:HD-GYP domain-containing protein (c-di-GMP phosphodiesterase class II)
MGLEETMTILSEGRGVHFDPEILNAFLNVAPLLYEKYANRDDDKLRSDLKAIMVQYYGPDLVKYIP